MQELAVNCLTDVMAAAIPFAIVFEVGNLIVGTFIRVAFGGKLWLGS